MSGPTLVLLPGLNNSRAVFDGVVAALDPAIDARAIDLPPLASVEAIADAVLADLPERFHLCGFSFGGYVALAMLARAPERIAGLALVGSLPAADSEAARENRSRAIETAQAGGYEAMVQTNASAAFHPESLKDEAIMARRAAMVADYGPDRFIAHSRAAMTRPDRTATLTGYAGPVLMLAGECDPLAPRERMEALVGAHRAHVVPGAGHLLPLEQPAATAALLSGWLRTA
ncbi:alpha/beta hydrolase [Sphingobium jiangsuense]|uniref:Pimeloyl-ACP methyl ester carboxylesterase n=1 Tax=Sphingobium jiangsuense TaxID=870476 RepID=A0A7W6BLI8_9SPHN|nr:alpha/beta fold hydrolase [Sphingobium jiangsuense]MBB3925960.1 pimeloyl-ACP methyl ester carboxylesterase [Sphingobium jiangsuense]GLS98894.1 alpha/beta hydrolase [Sphingobium jiangsuense]